jgi:hypothetical protein
MVDVGGMHALQKLEERDTEDKNQNNGHDAGNQDTLDIRRTQKMPRDEYDRRVAFHGDEREEDRSMDEVDGHKMSLVEIHVVHCRLPCQQQMMLERLQVSSSYQPSQMLLLQQLPWQQLQQHLLLQFWIFSLLDLLPLLQQVVGRH